MIKLVVEPFCHDCPNFEAEQDRTVLYSGNRIECMSDCTISCKHKNICNRISDYLNSVIKIKEVKKEMEE